jgi:hypothetical protein
LWARLELTGVPLDEPPFRDMTGVSEVQGGISIEQQGDVTSSMITEVGNGRIYYSFDLYVMNNLRGCPRRFRWEIELPWEDQFFEWMPDPAADESPDHAYSFREIPGFVYPRELVLNHRFAKPVAKGTVLEGLLLGMGCAAIPPEIRNGKRIDVKLTLVDQFDCEYSNVFNVWVDRSATLNRPAKSPRTPLFGNNRIPRRRLHARSVANSPAPPIRRRRAIAAINRQYPLAAKLHVKKRKR